MSTSLIIPIDKINLHKYLDNIYVVFDPNIKNIKHYIAFNIFNTRDNFELMYQTLIPVSGVENVHILSRLKGRLDDFDTQLFMFPDLIKEMKKLGELLVDQDIDEEFWWLAGNYFTCHLPSRRRREYILAILNNEEITVDGFKDFFNTHLETCKICQKTLKTIKKA